MYHGQTFEATVVGCTNLKDTQWFKKQNPYVHLEYGTSRWRTRSCSDGDTNPTFQEKFSSILIEGIREMTVEVWTRKTLSPDRFIGSGKIQLEKLYSEGLDNQSWTIVDMKNKFAGEVKLLLYCEALNNQPRPPQPQIVFPHPSPVPYPCPQPHQPLYEYPPQATIQYGQVPLGRYNFMPDYVLPRSSHHHPSCTNCPGPVLSWR